MLKLQDLATQAGILSIDQANAQLAKLVGKDFVDQLNKYLKDRRTPIGEAKDGLKWVIYSAVVLGNVRPAVEVMEALRVCSAAEILK